jgi:hypothetical protein
LPRSDCRQRPPVHPINRGWPPSIGIGGRFRSDCVAAFRRNQWPLCLGFRTPSQHRPSRRLRRRQGRGQGARTVRADRGWTVARPELESGNCFVRLEARTLDDIKALGGDEAEDERRFATVTRLSEAGQGVYRTSLCSALCAMATQCGAAWFRRLSPIRLAWISTQRNCPN